MAAQPAALKITCSGYASTAALLAMLLAGCVPPEVRTPEPARRTPVPAPAPAPAPAPPRTDGPIIRPIPEPEASLPAPAEPLPAPRTAPPANPASRALLAQSRTHQAAGDYAQAAASIERALRIDPRQPLLWLELGDIRLKEGDFAQAESLARKGLSLAGGDPSLTSRAEDLIARAKKR